MPKKVLIVEDHPLMMAALGKVARDLGAKVGYAKTIAEAEQHLADEQYDIIVWDGYLGQESTLSLIKQTAKRFKGPMIANSSDFSMAKAQMQFGCTDYPREGDAFDLLKKLIEK